MIRSVIIEQKPLLTKLLDRICPEIDFSVRTKNPQSGLKLVDQCHLNLVILDLDSMADSPCEFLRALREWQVPVVVVAKDYEKNLCPGSFPNCKVIQKPVYGARLLKAVRTACLEFTSASGRALSFWNVATPQLHPQVALDQVSVWKDGFPGFLPVKDIVYAEMDPQGTRFFLEDGTDVFSEKLIGWYYRKMDRRNAYKISKERMINQEHIQGIDYSNEIVYLPNLKHFRVEPNRMKGL